MKRAAAYQREPLPGGCQVLNYRIEEVLGTGSFGITYLALDVVKRVWVAIKEYFPVESAFRSGSSVVPLADPEAEEEYHWGLDQFGREAQVLTLVQHRNIVQVLRRFDANNTTYMVMAYEKGCSLGTFLRSEQEPLDEEEIKAVILPVADGLSHLHKLDLLHCDIKPDNIFIRDDGSPVVLDFGAARSMLVERGYGGDMALITAHYSPLEQYEIGRRPSPATDIYALCATAYHFITGAPPPDALSRHDAVRAGRPDPMLLAADAGRDRFSPRFLAAVDAGLALYADDRPRTLRNWLEAIEPPAADPPRRPAPRQTQVADPIKTPPKRRWLILLPFLAPILLFAFALMS